jgi:hypothetical protein
MFNKEVFNKEVFNKEVFNKEYTYNLLKNHFFYSRGDI